jgi:hypothetical protein
MVTEKMNFMNDSSGMRRPVTCDSGRYKSQIYAFNAMFCVYMCPAASVAVVTANLLDENTMFECRNLERVHFTVVK